MKKGWLFSVASSLVFLSFNLSAYAANTLWSTPNGFKNLAQLKGFTYSLCPKAVFSKKSGLFTPILPKWTVCLHDLSIIKSSTSTIDFPLNGNAQLGTPFIPLDSEEGDVQTSWFTVGHYPAITQYSFTNFDLYSIFTVSYFSAQTETNLFSFRRHGQAGAPQTSVDGEAYFVGRGTYYMRVDTDNQSNQPLYSLTPGFMEPYVGFPVSSSDLKSAHVKSFKCPRYFLDLRTGHVTSPGGKYSCTNSSTESLQNAGLTLAPYSLANGMFMTTGVNAALMGDGGVLPFRIVKSTPLTYSVVDPSDQQLGRTRFLLKNLATGNIEQVLASVTGSITGTITYLNQPGEYILEVETIPYRPNQFGDIGWGVSVEGL